MRRLRSHAKPATPSASAAAAIPDQATAPQSPPPPAMETGGLSGTPAPSPSTSASRGLGSSAADGGALKSPDAGPGTGTPRRSLRLAGAASPVGSSVLDGASSGAASRSGGKRRGRPRVSALAAASHKEVESLTDGGGGGGEVTASGGGGGCNIQRSSQSGPRLAKRPMDPTADASEETAIGSDGGAGSGDNKVYDEMPHRDAKRRKSTLVRGADYVPDSESESDKDSVLPAEGGTSGVLAEVAYYVPDSESEKEDCVPLGGGGMKVLARLSASASLIDLNVVPVGLDVADEGRRDGSVRAADGEAEEANGRNGHLLSGESMRVHESAEAAAAAHIVKSLLASPVAMSATAEANKDMNSSEDLLRHESGDKGKGKEKLVLGNNDSGAAAANMADAQDWPGPFSTAMRIMDDRDAKLRARELNPSKLDSVADKVISWTPSRDKKKTPVRPVPSLTSLCLRTLANNAEGIESLGGISEELKNKLLMELCHSRKMNTHLLTELLCDNPVTLQLSEYSWLSEDDFGNIFGKCMTESLEVLQLDLSGRCMPDYMLPATLAKAPNCMPLLRKISLMGNHRFSDIGLDTIISAAPSLSSLNLSECSLLTSTGIENLAKRLHSVLRELYIDDCLNVDAMVILPALQKIEHLEVLSMSRIQSVCDKFVNELIPTHGSNLRELAFAGCLKLTSSSIKTIGVNCPQLSSLDLRNLNRLRDSALRHLRGGCRLIKKLKFQKNAFSDEAVSKYLEESGGCLTELSLNNVGKVGNLTAQAIALKCSLEVLDLSFCRGLTDEALGLIVDSCSSLRILKLFGCTQVTDVFLKGHSNSLVKIIGIEGSILDQMDRS
ncbi:hypothetical protein QYE76_031266 [Lolium multiflorum]|uniref:F-box/LRR-repeat protein 15-like leucin rich repeat domain-containing protein n=1 Tax=Lolium multiflorum TaxID=4521 RepID=A0AAD8VK53_LOLMU|nr:hypothetical protein QYE76_031266 [Lolium multiflorum]